MTDISTSAFGTSSAPTVALAGGFLSKYFEYSVLNSLKRAIDERYTLDWRTSLKLYPAACRIVLMFSMTLMVWSFILFEIILFSLGSIASWPETNKNLEALTAWL